MLNACGSTRFLVGPALSARLFARRSQRNRRTRIGIWFFRMDYRVAKHNPVEQESTQPKAVVLNTRGARYIMPLVLRPYSAESETFLIRTISAGVYEIVELAINDCANTYRRRTRSHRRRNCSVVLEVRLSCLMRARGLPERHQRCRDVASRAECLHGVQERLPCAHVKLHLFWLNGPFIPLTTTHLIVHPLICVDRARV